VKETKKEKNFIRDEKCVSFKNNWLIGKGSSFSSFSSSSCVCYILSSLLRQLSLLHQDGERLVSANDVLLLLLLLFVPLNELRYRGQTVLLDDVFVVVVVVFSSDKITTRTEKGDRGVVVDVL
jgi:hypothetical protein